MWVGKQIGVWKDWGGTPGGHGRPRDGGGRAGHACCCKLWACLDQVRHHPPPSTARQPLEHVSRPHLPQVAAKAKDGNAQNVANMIWAYATLGGSRSSHTRREKKFKLHSLAIA